MILSFRYHNTNCFFIWNNSREEVLAIDAGWPCTFNEYKKNLKPLGIKFEDIKYAVVTHFHMDHAGLIGDFVYSGVQCLTFDLQVFAIDEMERIIQKNKEYFEYRRIQKDKLIIRSLDELNLLFKKHGFKIYAEPLNSHSDDHVGFFVGEREVIIGDLAPIDQIMKDNQKANENWERIIGKGIKIAYPSHADTLTL